MQLDAHDHQKLSAWNETTTDNDRRIFVHAQYLGPIGTFRPQVIEQLLRELLANYGDLQEYQKLSVQEPGVVRVAATLQAKTAAKAATQALDGFKIQVRYSSFLSAYTGAYSTLFLSELSTVGDTRLRKLSGLFDP
jgi:hypothetical protein